MSSSKKMNRDVSSPQKTEESSDFSEIIKKYISPKEKNQIEPFSPKLNKVEDQKFGVQKFFKPYDKDSGKGSRSNSYKNFVLSQSGEGLNLNKGNFDN